MKKNTLQLLTHLCDKVVLETVFGDVVPAVGAGHLLPPVTVLRGLSGAVGILLAATPVAHLVHGNVGPEHLLPREVARGKEYQGGVAVERFRTHREEHGAGEAERDRKARKPAPHHHLFGVAAKAANPRVEFGFVVHLGQRQRFVWTPGSVGFREEGESLIGAERLHVQRYNGPHLPREENYVCIISLTWGVL